MNERFPLTGEDTIHPKTTMAIHVFGVGRETIEFPPDKVILKIRRNSPSKAVSGLLTIDTEMTELSLVGNSKLLGPLTLRGGSSVLKDRPITGKIIETAPGRAFPAENFFDVLIEIDTEKGKYVNKKPEHMVATIDQIPPDFGRTPYKATTEILLYDRNNLDGAPVAAIEAVQHKAAETLIGSE